MGCLHIYTGDGKGKTTAAIGLAIRAAGAGKKVAFVIFDKGEVAERDYYSERNILRCIAEIDLFTFGVPRLKADGSFRNTVSEKDIEEAHRGLQTLEQLIKLPQYFLIVADEIITCAARGLINYESLYELLLKYKRKPLAELVLTGRGATQRLIEMADLVTEMKNIKHYYSLKRPAVKGIDF